MAFVNFLLLFLVWASCVSCRLRTADVAMGGAASEVPDETMAGAGQSAGDVEMVVVEATQADGTSKSSDDAIPEEFLNRDRVDSQATPMSVDAQVTPMSQAQGSHVKAAAEQLPSANEQVQRAINYLERSPYRVSPYAKNPDDEVRKRIERAQQVAHVNQLIENSQEQIAHAQAQVAHVSTQMAMAQHQEHLIEGQETAKISSQSRPSAAKAGSHPAAPTVEGSQTSPVYARPRATSYGNVALPSERLPEVPSDVAAELAQTALLQTTQIWEANLHQLQQSAPNLLSLLMANQDLLYYMCSEPGFGLKAKEILEKSIAASGQLDQTEFHNELQLHLSKPLHQEMMNGALPRNAATNGTNGSGINSSGVGIDAKSLVGAAAPHLSVEVPGDPLQGMSAEQIAGLVALNNKMIVDAISSTGIGAAPGAGNGVPNESDAKGSSSTASSPEGHPRGESGAMLTGKPVPGSTQAAAELAAKFNSYWNKAATPLTMQMIASMQAGNPQALQTVNAHVWANAANMQANMHGATQTTMQGGAQVGSMQAGGQGPGLSHPVAAHTMAEMAWGGMQNMPAQNLAFLQHMQQITQMMQQFSQSPAAAATQHSAAEGHQHCPAPNAAEGSEHPSAPDAAERSPAQGVVHQQNMEVVQHNIRQMMAQNPVFKASVDTAAAHAMISGISPQQFMGYLHQLIVAQTPQTLMAQLAHTLQTSISQLVQTPQTSTSQPLQTATGLQTATEMSPLGLTQLTQEATAQGFMAGTNQQAVSQGVMDEQVMAQHVAAQTLVAQQLSATAQQHFAIASAIAQQTAAMQSMQATMQHGMQPGVLGQIAPGAMEHMPAMSYMMSGMMPGVPWVDQSGNAIFNPMVMFNPAAAVQQSGATGSSVQPLGQSSQADVKKDTQNGGSKHDGSKPGRSKGPSDLQISIRRSNTDRRSDRPGTGRADTTGCHGEQDGRQRRRGNRQDVRPNGMRDDRRDGGHDGRHVGRHGRQDRTGAITPEEYDATKTANKERRMSRGSRKDDFDDYQDQVDAFFAKQGKDGDAPAKESHDADIARGSVHSQPLERGRGSAETSGNIVGGLRKQPTHPWWAQESDDDSPADDNIPDGLRSGGMTEDDIAKSRTTLDPDSQIETGYAKDAPFEGQETNIDPEARDDVGDIHKESLGLDVDSVATSMAASSPATTWSAMDLSSGAMRSTGRSQRGQASGTRRDQQRNEQRTVTYTPHSVVEAYQQNLGSPEDLPDNPEIPSVDEYGNTIETLRARSEGSRYHGKLDSTGDEACRPCAWFFKSKSCQSEATCRYCHACNKSELKKRKKRKILRKGRQ